MHNGFLVLIALLSMFLTGCMTSSGLFSKKRTSTVTEKRATPVRKTRQKKDVQYTFLDTINSGNELLLHDADFKESVATGSGTDGNGTFSGSQFRVQVFASNRIESVREQKKELEKSTEGLVQIGYEAPYYKLYAGGFTKKREAQVMLKKLKKAGYLDAWIVTSKE